MSTKDQRHPDPAPQQARPTPPVVPVASVGSAVLYTSPITLEVQAAVVTGLNALDGTVVLTVFPRSVRAPGDSADPHRHAAQVFAVESVAITGAWPGTPAARGCWSPRS